MTCPICKEEIEDGSIVCPVCGTQLVPTLSEEQRKGGLRTTIVLFLVAILVAAAFCAVVLDWREAQVRNSRIEREAAIAALPSATSPSPADSSGR